MGESFDIFCELFIKFDGKPLKKDYNEDRKKILLEQILKEEFL